MATETLSFLRRARLFFSSLQANRYPNSSTLADECGCSKNTAQRTIYRMRDEYLVPIDYDPTERGYFLRDRNFQLPALLPAGKDELTALLLACNLIEGLEAEDLKTNLQALWAQFASSNPSVQRDLAPLAKVFSADSTMVQEIADTGLLRFVSAAAAGECVRLRYQSPWRHLEEKQYEGKILRVHFSDGNLYLLFTETSGREFVLNAAFVKKFEILDRSLTFGRAEGKKLGSEHWLEGFGVWAGEELEQIEIRIAYPASEYYSAQRWHPEQDDVWDGDVLIRRFPSIVSPELVRRVLSLGRFVTSVAPQPLQEIVREEAEALGRALGK